MFFFKQIDKKMIFKFGIGGGLAEIIYVLLVALIISFANQVMPQSPFYWGFAFFLLLLVLSAAISGFFVMGYPIYLALQKRYQEAIMTLLITLITIFGGFVIVFAFMFLIKY
ncbi:MAG: hypothetical protein NTX00_04675 [Candidatus Parcubacteria bacterium]|nr:hypothetical protein [Candidatus Parcubacteria bacterium]